MSNLLALRYDDASLDKYCSDVLRSATYMLCNHRHDPAVRYIRSCLLSEVFEHCQDVLFSFVLLLLQWGAKIVVEIFSHFVCIFNYFIYLCK